MALVNPNIALAGTPMQVPNLLGMQQTAARTQNQLARTDIMKDQAAMEKDTYTYETALSRSKDALRFVNSPEDYLAWTESSINDPVLGPILRDMGVDPERALASAREQLQQPGGLQTAVGRSAASIDQLAQSMTAQGGQARAQAQAQAQAARSQQARAAQMAQVNAVMGGQGGAPTAAPSRGAPAATATPVAPPADTMQYEPGTPGAINQLYGSARQAQTPVANALAQAPAGQPPVAQPPMRQAPAGQPPAAGVDPRMGQLLELDRLAVAGNELAARQAKTLRAQMEFEQDMRPDTPTPTNDYKNYEVAVSQGYPGSFVDYQKETMPSNFQDEFTKTLGKKRAEANLETVQKAEAAAQALPKIYGTLDLIEDSDTITGVGAELLTGLERLRSQFMGDVEAGRRVANTQTLNAYLGSEVFPLINSLGIGARGLDTPAEREFLREVMTGTITLDRDTLINLTNLRRDAALDTINRYNKQVEEGKLDDYYQVIGQEPTKIEPPQRSRGGLSPEDQQALNWANSNPNDPRAAQIKQQLGR